MATQDTFSGAKNAFTMMMSYLNAVAHEIGMDRAVALDAQACEAMGVAQGKAMKDRAGTKHVDIKTAVSMALESIGEAFGIDSEVIEESPRRVTTRCGRCPVYEGSLAAGLDTGTIETLCRNASMGFMDKLVKQLNPNLTYRLKKFRHAPGDFCEEEILLS